MFHKTAHSVVDRLQRFFTGDYPNGTSGLQELMVRADAGQDWPAIVTAQTMVFLPRGGETPLPEGSSVVRYEGSLDPDGEVLELEGRFSITAAGYTAAGFVPVSGPTLIRMTCSEDFHDYLEDADAAQAGQGFRPYLLHPLVSLADRCALGSSECCPSSAGLRAAAGPGRTLAPTLFADAATLSEPCLHGIVEDQLVAQARQTRPWLSRYLTVLDVLQRLPDKGGPNAQVSGFGFRVIDAEELPIEANKAPVLVRTDEGFTIVDPLSARVLSAPRDAAAVIEMLSLHPGDDGVDVVGEQLGLTGEAAFAAVSKVRAQLPTLPQPMAGV